MIFFLRSLYQFARNLFEYYDAIIWKLYNDLFGGIILFLFFHPPSFRQKLSKTKKSHKNTQFEYEIHKCTQPEKLQNVARIVWRTKGEKKVPVDDMQKRCIIEQTNFQSNASLSNIKIVEVEDQPEWITKKKKLCKSTEAVNKNSNEKSPWFVPFCMQCKLFCILIHLHIFKEEESREKLNFCFFFDKSHR